MCVQVGRAPDRMAGPPAEHVGAYVDTGRSDCGNGLEATPRESAITHQAEDRSTDGPLGSRWTPRALAKNRMIS
jgi:hypothetical protein